MRLFVILLDRSASTTKHYSLYIKSNNGDRQGVLFIRKPLLVICMDENEWDD